MSDSRVKCDQCHRKVPVKNGKLVKHWAAGWIGRKIFLVGDRICEGSDTTVELNQKRLQEEKKIY